jgi:hypothetical protein
MKRLGYTKYVAQGGDWGALITQLMGAQAAPELLAIHTNMPGAVPPDIDKAAFAGAPAPSGLSVDEQHAYDQLVFFYTHGLAYAQEMGNRPQTLYGIADSPIGLAGWVLDHDRDSYEMIARVFDGKPEGLTRDDLLDNITFYWLTNTAILQGLHLIRTEHLPARIGSSPGQFHRRRLRRGLASIHSSRTSGDGSVRRGVTPATHRGSDHSCCPVRAIGP